jgi:hypothetical protein
MLSMESLRDMFCLTPGVQRSELKSSPQSHPSDAELIAYLRSVQGCLERQVAVLV